MFGSIVLLRIVGHPGRPTHGRQRCAATRWTVAAAPRAGILPAPGPTQVFRAAYPEDLNQELYKGSRPPPPRNALPPPLCCRSLRSLPIGRPPKPCEPSCVLLSRRRRRVNIAALFGRSAQAGHRPEQASVPSRSEFGRLRSNLVEHSPRLIEISPDSVDTGIIWLNTAWILSK